MPNYVYRCPAGHTEEIRHGFHEDPEITCEQCGGEMKRVPQPFRFYINPTLVLLDRMNRAYTAKLREKEAIKRGNYGAITGKRGLERAD